VEDAIESFHEPVFCKPFTDRAVEQIIRFFAVFGGIEIFAEGCFGFLRPVIAKAVQGT
jgi:hypothetical protein